MIDPAADPLTYWDAIYADKPPDEVSWFQPQPRTSLELLVDTSGSVIDVGAGASVLVDRLLATGRGDVTLLDASAEALEVTRSRLGQAAGSVTFEVADLTTWVPRRSYDVWHDRAVFHFLVDDGARATYLARASDAVVPGGALVVGTFAADGPTSCSGLPVSRFEPGELAAFFGGSFAFESCRHEDHTTPWGAVQRFSWVVLRRRADHRP